MSCDRHSDGCACPKCLNMRAARFTVKTAKVPVMIQIDSVPSTVVSFDQLIIAEPHSFNWMCFCEDCKAIRGKRVVENRLVLEQAHKLTKHLDDLFEEPPEQIPTGRRIKV